MPSLLHSIVPPATATTGTPSLCDAASAAARSARNIPVTDEKLRMPAPRALALRSGTAVVAPSLKTPRRLCFLSPRPRKVLVTEVLNKISTGRRLIHRGEGESSTPRRLCFISPLVPPKTKKQRHEGEDDDEDKDTASQLVGVDIEDQEEEQDHEELEAVVHEEEEDIFLSAQEDEEDEDILLSPQEEDEDAVPVEVDEEGDIVFTKITRSPQHADADAGSDGDDSVPIAVLFHNKDNKKKQPVKDNPTRMDETTTMATTVTRVDPNVDVEVEFLPSPRLIRDTVDYTVERPGVAAVVHQPAPEEKVVTPSSTPTSTTSAITTTMNQSALLTALLAPPLATLHKRMPLRPRPSFSSHGNDSKTNARNHAYDATVPSLIRGPIRPDAVAISLARLASDTTARNRYYAAHAKQTVDPARFRKYHHEGGGLP